MEVYHAPRMQVHLIKTTAFLLEMLPQERLVLKSQENPPLLVVLYNVVTSADNYVCYTAITSM